MKLGVCFQILSDCNMSCVYCYGKYVGSSGNVLNDYITITPTGQLVYYDYENKKRNYTESVINNASINDLLNISKVKGDRP